MYVVVKEYIRDDRNEPAPDDWQFNREYQLSGSSAAKLAAHNAVDAVYFHYVLVVLDYPYSGRTVPELKLVYSSLLYDSRGKIIYDGRYTCKHKHLSRSLIPLEGFRVETIEREPSLSDDLVDEAFTLVTEAAIYKATKKSVKLPREDSRKTVTAYVRVYRRIPVEKLPLKRLTHEVVLDFIRTSALQDLTDPAKP